MSLLCLALCISLVYSRYTPQDVFGTFAATPEVYDQKLDHFNAYNSATFKQRWFYNDNYWSPESFAPIIFQAGGEGQNNGNFYGFVEEFAVEVGALLVTAEHRFYGKSRPFGDGAANYEPSSDRLGLLQVEQAMADYLELMTFWKSSNPYFKNCSLCPVIVVGGSYPGELSVWLRMKYPHMFDMALGASAPIFYTSNNLVKAGAYYEVVTNAVHKISATCVDYVRAAYAVLMKSSDAEIINGIPICPNTYRNIDELQALLYESWANYAMGNYPPSTSSMRSACTRIENGAISDGLAIWNRFFAPSLNRNGCLDMNGYIPNGANGTVHCSDLTGCGSGYDGESWDYQACSQNIEPFSTNNVTDMFPVYAWSMDWLDQHCMSRFKIKASDRESWMEKEFGLAAPYFESRFADITSRIIFSNGEQDGWSAGGVLKNMSDSLIAIVIPNGAHHSDMRGSSASDTQDIINARQQEKDILKQWIKQVQQENM